MKLAVLLLLLVASGHFGPELLAAVTAGTVGAWDYVLTGAASACLWAVAGVLVGTHRPALPHAWVAQAVAALGAWESAQRPLCRLLLPMGAPPQTGGRTLCEAALGASVNWVGLVLALAVALLVQEAGHEWRR